MVALIVDIYYLLFEVFFIMFYQFIILPDLLSLLYLFDFKLSYLLYPIQPLAGSIVAVIISVLFYIVLNRDFQVDYFIRPIIYFFVFSAVGLLGRRFLNDALLVRKKNVIFVLVILFLLIQFLAYLKIL